MENTLIVSPCCGKDEMSRQRFGEEDCGMVDKARVTELIYSAIDEYNDGLPEGHGLVKAPDTPLYGRESHLDSLGLVSLIVDVEYAVGEEYGCTITLTNDRALSQRGSPFRTVSTLADYIVQQMEKTNA